VILSWKASAPADAKHAAADGYCIYRGTERGDRSLVLVNHVPFPGTSCTDDTVQNGKTYYYKVKAISEKGTPSKPSNLAPARISNRKPTNPVASPPPVCRVADDVR
jgi:fibronectin type 3 domain-containing protein